MHPKALIQFCKIPSKNDDVVFDQLWKVNIGVAVFIKVFDATHQTGIDHGKNRMDLKEMTRCTNRIIGREPQCLKTAIQTLFHVQSDCKSSAAVVLDPTLALCLRLINMQSDSMHRPAMYLGFCTSRLPCLLTAYGVHRPSITPE